MKKNIFIGIISLILAFSFIACEEEEEPEAEDTFLGFKLTVTGIPAGTDITVATLVTSGSQVPSAVGYNVDGVFELFLPVSAQQPMPSDKPFNTNGSYQVMLVKADQSYNPTQYWAKTEGQGFALVPFSGPVTTMAWSDFTDVTTTIQQMQQGQGQNP